MKRAIAEFCAACALAAGTACAAAPATEWAKEEFATFSSKIFGFVPEVEFVLPGESGDFKEDFKALKGTDGYAVRRRGGKIVFVADCPRGHVNGVHRWLERNSDVIWPRPVGDMCLFTPRREAKAADLECDWRDVPAFRVRHLGAESKDPELWRWQARNCFTSMVAPRLMDDAQRAEAERYGIALNVFGAGHSMERQWFPRSEFLKDHPEWYMLAGGQRGPGESCNFCETNPDLPAAYAKSVLEKIANLPSSVTTLQICMEDTSVTCQCPECTKPLRLEDGTVVQPDDPAFKSTRFFAFFNKVARIVGAARPDLGIRQYAYQHLSEPPKVKLEPNITVLLCPYPRNMKESVVEGPSNAKWRKRVDAWLANTPNIYWREYYFCGCIYFPRPIADTEKPDLLYLLKHGVQEVYTDSPGRSGDNRRRLNRTFGLNRPFAQFYDVNGMENWVAGRMFWDPHQDPAALRRHFLTRTFGPAAEAVGEFYSLVHKAWYSDARPSRYDDSPFESAAYYIVGKGIAAKCTAALEKAAALADRPERAEWIAHMRDVLNTWIKEASNYSSMELEIPFSKDASRAAEFPELKLAGSVKGLDATRSVFRIRSDGAAFVVDAEVKKPFVEGERAEISFAPVRGGIYTFPLAVTGRTKVGWAASAKIPFEKANFAPHVHSKVKCLPRLLLKDAPGASAIDFTWQGGLPLMPEGWGTAFVNLEF